MLDVVWRRQDWQVWINSGTIRISKSLSLRFGTLIFTSNGWVVHNIWGLVWSENARRGALYQLRATEGIGKSIVNPCNWKLGFYQSSRRMQTFILSLQTSATAQLLRLATISLLSSLARNTITSGVVSTLVFTRLYNVSSGRCEPIISNHLGNGVAIQYQHHSIYKSGRDASRAQRVCNSINHFCDEVKWFQSIKTHNRSSNWNIIRYFSYIMFFSFSLPREASLMWNRNYDSLTKRLV